jgi:Frag1/DRAM/Sfk1 family
MSKLCELNQSCNLSVSRVLQFYLWNWKKENTKFKWLLSSGRLCLKILLVILQAVNFLPSISAAVGGFSPQRYIWRICIALHCTPRFALAVCYHRLYMIYADEIATQRYRLYCILIYAITSVYILENTCLLILSFVSSTENYGNHKFC